MSFEIEFERMIAAPCERVFDAFTSAEGQIEFYGRDEPGWIVESSCDLRVGGIWAVRFGSSREELWSHRHVFEEIDRPNRVRMSTTELRLDGTTLETEMTFEFESRGERTLMRLRQTGLPTAELREEHTRGVPHAFDRFERWLDASNPIDE